MNEKYYISDKVFFNDLDLTKETINVPHPSRGNWQLNKNSNEIKTMKEEIKKIKEYKNATEKVYF